MSLIILNFHGVGSVSRSIDNGERDRWLEKDAFEAMLDIVRDHPNVRLTVDDGNASDFEIILPALLRRGLKATFFVCSGRLDEPTFLSRAQLRELVAKGMTIGSHGIDHLSWRKLSSTRLWDELQGSRRILEEVCGRPIDTAACPFGAYDRVVLNALRRTGYRSVYTSDGGTAAEEDWLRARTTITRSMKFGEIQRLVGQGFGVREQCLISARKLLKGFR